MALHSDESWLFIAPAHDTSPDSHGAKEISRSYLVLSLKWDSMKILTWILFTWHRLTYKFDPTYFGVKLKCHAMSCITDVSMQTKVRSGFKKGYQIFNKKLNSHQKHQLMVWYVPARLDSERDEMVDRTTTLWKGCETALEWTRQNFAALSTWCLHSSLSPLSLKTSTSSAVLFCSPGSQEGMRFASS